VSFNFSLIISNSNALRSGTRGSAGCLSVCLPNITNTIYIEQLREMVPPPSQNTVAVCKQDTFLAPYYIRSRLVTLLKTTDAPIQVPDVLILLLDLSTSISAFRYSFLPQSLLTSSLKLFRFFTVLWFGFSNYCNLACFLRSKS
jgi:hypothetical protein